MGAPNLEQDGQPKKMSREDALREKAKSVDWKKKGGAAGAALGFLVMNMWAEPFGRIIASLHIDKLATMIPGGTAFLPVILFGAIGTAVGMFLDTELKR